MIPLSLNSDELSLRLLSLSRTEKVSILDSCGLQNASGRYLIAGVRPVDTIEFSGPAEAVLRELSAALLTPGYASIFTLSYDFGADLHSRSTRSKKPGIIPEPSAHLARYDSLIVHDYQTSHTFTTGPGDIEFLKSTLQKAEPYAPAHHPDPLSISSNFTHDEYIDAVETVLEHIRSGSTYQANLTQQIVAQLAPTTSARDVFSRLRRDNPATYSAFIVRDGSIVVSSSPELFFRVTEDTITTSPIKGTIRRGRTPEEDAALRRRLERSEKNRCENTMIVDLLRNDLGRICEFGSVRVNSLCIVEEHPTLFHLVSTISGDLRPHTDLSEIIKALFPCGSITGAPKIRTMEIIDELETAPRGLSMGAIGLRVPAQGFAGIDPHTELSVAIRTMVVADGHAVFNVGGGIVIDSDPESEYQESLLKAKALVAALGPGQG